VPDERLGVLVPVLDPVADVGGECFDAGVCGAMKAAVRTVRGIGSRAEPAVAALAAVGRTWRSPDRVGMCAGGDALVVPVESFLAPLYQRAAADAAVACGLGL
jgi:hypothetical protein